MKIGRHQQEILDAAKEYFGVDLSNIASAYPEPPKLPPTLELTFVDGKTVTMQTGPEMMGPFFEGEKKMTATVRNGIKPQYRALAVLVLDEAITPAQIDAAVGTEGYASKYISLLRKDGFVFDVEKDGRKVASYTLVSEPENANEFRNMKPKEKAVKAPKVKKEKTEKTPTAKAATKKAKKAPKVIDVAEEDKADEDYFVGSVGSLDDDFDELQGVDLKDLI